MSKTNSEGASEGTAYKHTLFKGLTHIILQSTKNGRLRNFNRMPKAYRIYDLYSGSGKYKKKLISAKDAVHFVGSPLQLLMGRERARTAKTGFSIPCRFFFNDNDPRKIEQLEENVQEFFLNTPEAETK